MFILALMEFFTDDELKCKCGCDQLVLNTEFAIRLNGLRAACGFPFPVSSGYRCVSHNEAVGGHSNSSHVKGKACDILVSGHNAAILISRASAQGFSIGISQKGDVGSRFIHVDLGHENFALWSY